MQDIRITRYKHPIASGWAGYLEPADKSWIAFIGLDGAPQFFLNRDPETGAILPDDPAEHAAHIAVLRESPGLRIGMIYDGSSENSALEPGERVFPLGYDGRSGLAGMTEPSG